MSRQRCALCDMALQIQDGCCQKSPPRNSVFKVCITPKARLTGQQQLLCFYRLDLALCGEHVYLSNGMEHLVAYLQRIPT